MGRANVAKTVRSRGRRARPEHEFVFELGDLDRVQIRAVIQPHASSLAIVADAVTGQRRGLPEHVRAQVASVVRPVSPALMLPTLESVPGRLAIAHHDRSPRTTTELVHQWLEEGSGALEEELSTRRDPLPPQLERLILQDTSAWMHQVGRVYLDAAPVVDDLTRRADWYFQREIARIGAAVLGGGTEALLNSIVPSMTVEGTELRRAFRLPVRWRLRGQLVLVPMISGPAAIAIGTNGSDIVISYPLPGAGLLGAELPAAPADNDRVALVLGATRAAILRLLTTQTTMYGITSHLSIGASSATYHCGKLVEAGLATRHRRGNSIWLVRTQRGDALLDTLSN